MTIEYIRFVTPQVFNVKIKFKNEICQALHKLGNWGAILRIFDLLNNLRTDRNVFANENISREANDLAYYPLASDLIRFILRKRTGAISK